jgi:hypothetical protein
VEELQRTTFSVQEKNAMKPRWRLLCSALSQSDGIMRRTFGMNMPNGGMLVSVEVDKGEDAPVAVAVTYVPHNQMSHKEESDAELLELQSLSGEEGRDGDGGATLV